MKLIITCLLFIFSLSAIKAQVTTGTLSGTIKDQQNTLPGVTVRATHIPSGTSYVNTTNEDGRFTINNMRPGGPYKVVVSYVGMDAKTIENLNIPLGDTYILNLSMGGAGKDLSEVNIKGLGKNSVLNANRTGTSTNLNKNEINALPTLNRSLFDLIRLTPQANGSAIGGGNSRQNNVTIDGADFNNNFGIGNNLPGNGNPVSIDALEEISVNLTPYDVKQTGFIGASINAVTRSGTNDFSGSVYTYFRNQNQIGKKVSNYPELADPTNQTYKTYGARIGGPIIKNKLFFFLNAEREDRVSPGQTRVAATPEAPYNSGIPNVVRPTVSELDEISNYLKTTYGYDPGIYQGYGSEFQRTNLLGRLDWNINDNNRFNIRGSYVKTKSPSFVSTSRSPLGAFPGGGSRTGNTALAFKNSNYYQESNLYSITAELNSKLFNRFANTLRLSYTNQNDPRSSDSDVFPLVDILKADGNSPPTPFTTFGYEPFTYGNLRDVQVYSLNDYMSWSAGKHNITAGIQGDYSIIKNGFQRFGTSYYTFNSWDDFKNSAKPIEFAQTYSLSPNYEQAFPTYKFWQFSGYAQDEISVTERLRLTGGIRLELGTYPKVLIEHPLVSALTFKDGERLNTGNLPKSRVSISPRFGFNWDVKGDRSIQLRGGAGIFVGRIPNVWIVAQAGDAGMLQITETYSGQNNTPGPFNPNIGAYRPAVVPTAGTVLPNPVTVMDKNLKMPAAFKTSLAADFKLPFGIVGTVEGIYNKDLRTLLFRNANLVDPTPLNVAGYPDNRLIYPNAATDKFINPILNGQAVKNGTVIPGGSSVRQPDAFNVIILGNSDKGYYYSLSGTLSKRFTNGFGATISYVKSAAKSLYEGGGDQTLSSWQATSSVDGANNPTLGYSGFVSPDRIIASVYYRKEFFKHLGTQFTLVYDGSNGRSSYTYSTDINRDGVTGDLIYVPKDPSEITFVALTVGTGTDATTFTPKQQSDLFFRYIDQDKYLRGRKGQYAERNAVITPFNGQFDFRFQQDIFTNIGKKRNTIQFNLDVTNFGNLLNRDWGVQRNFGTTSVLVPVNVAALTPGGTTKPTFRIQTDRNFPIVNTTRDVVGFASTYTMQFGFRYIFN
ncbi:carboxypeptidase regulatory-like domain-containing protein [Pedobacter lithocola]|uniref:Carboxypeptidase regulatory-like domain-containing protein n=1 Tax=Pedobacter lithocola TaxID=1908239 RepID=A0ABV8PAZ5_9SPHI